MLVTKITGSQIRAARALCNLTRDDLANRANVSRDCIRYWEHSSDAIPPARLRDFSRAIDALEEAGIEFRPDGVFYARAVPIRSVTVHSEAHA